MRKFGREVTGQTLVQLALLLTVLFAFVAMAVDFGRVYMERRRLQNAADAGALAAARARCFGGEGGTLGTVAQARAAGELYATSLEYNGAPEADVTTDDGWTYTVTTTKNVEMTFASVVGLSTVPTHALAAAKCGGVTDACGMWPIAFNESIFDDLYAASCVSEPGTPQDLYIWSGYHGGQTCKDPEDPSCCYDADDPSCTGVCEDWNCKDPQCGVLFDCDATQNGLDDGPWVVFTDQGRAWLDFSGFQDPNNPAGQCPTNGCGTAELGYCIEGTPNIKLSLPACISGDVGVKGGTKQEVIGRKGEVVGLPLFSDRTCEVVGDCKYPYEIIQIACIKIDDKSPWFHLKLKVLKSAPQGTPQWWHGWMIKASVACGGCNTNCGGTSDPAPTPEPGKMRGVSLIR